MSATVYSWGEMETDRPIPLIARKKIVGKNIFLANVVLSPGCHVPTHQHENEQFAFVVSGQAIFGIGAEGSPERKTVIVNAGEVITLPSNTPHSCTVEVETRIIDVLSPPQGGMGIDAMAAAGNAQN